MWNAQVLAVRSVSHCHEYSQRVAIRIVANYSQVSRGECFSVFNNVIMFVFFLIFPRNDYALFSVSSLKDEKLI